MNLEIDVWGSLDFDTIDSFINENLNNINFDNKYKDVIYNFRGLTFISPTGFCLLACLIKYLKYHDIAENYILFEPYDDNVNSYFRRMDFYESLGIDVQNNYCRNDCSTRLLELKEITGDHRNEDSRIAEHFKNILQNQLRGDVEIFDAVSYSIGEIVDNTNRHAMSPINGFVCAQTYANKRKLEICIADCGIGIAESLRENNNINKEDIIKLIDDNDYIEYALKKGVSSKFNAGHTGEGLYFTSEFIKENRGRMKIISGNGLYLLQNGNNHLKGNVNRWQGTVVALEFDLDNYVDITQIFNRETPDVDDALDWF